MWVSICERNGFLHNNHSFPIFILLCKKVLGCILKTSLCVPVLIRSTEILLGFDNRMSHMWKALTSNKSFHGKKNAINIYGILLFFRFLGIFLQKKVKVYLFILRRYVVTFSRRWKVMNCQFKVSILIWARHYVMKSRSIF